MMSNCTDKAVPKIVDFGLAKIIGPTCTASEPFGTLGYVAPEVLSKKPYTFSCDVWSLGCVIYACLSGSLPFDHENQEETIRMTMEDRLIFDLPCWKRISPLAKDLLEKLLIKDAKERISMEQAMAHPWFQNSRQKFKPNEMAETSKQPQPLKAMSLNQTREGSFIQKVSSQVAQPQKQRKNKMVAV